MDTPLTKFRDTRPFWYWINERHAIYLRRKENPTGPWTDDPILRNYRFCNVFRELDTVTIWIRERWRIPYAEHKNLWFAMALARNVNWPDSLHELQTEADFPEDWDAKKFVNVLRNRANRGDKTFGSGYMITNGGLSIPKEVYVAEHVLQPIWKQRHKIDSVLDSQPSLEAAWKAFRGFDGFGPFIAYEVVTDLRHTRYLNNATDIMTWANAGPGALRGLNRLLGRHPDASLRAQTALALMRTLLATANAPDSPLMPFVPRPFEIRDIEHSLCETDKYLRAKLKEGKPRATYDWQNAKPLATSDFIRASQEGV